MIGWLALVADPATDHPATAPPPPAGSATAPAARLCRATGGEAASFGSGSSVRYGGTTSTAGPPTTLTATADPTTPFNGNDIPPTTTNDRDALVGLKNRRLEKQGQKSLFLSINPSP
jgi:hypothetical protein